MWDASPTPTVTGYKLHTGTTCSNLATVLDVGDVLTASLTLAPGHYCFAVSAYDAAGYESAYSNKVETDVPGAVPTKIKEFRRM